MSIQNIAYWTAQSGTTPLTNFENTKVLSLPLPFSQDAIQFFVVFGRVVIQNLDGSPQNASAVLDTSTTTTDLDRVDVRIAADDSSPALRRYRSCECFIWTLAAQVIPSTFPARLSTQLHRRPR